LKTGLLASGGLLLAGIMAAFDLSVLAIATVTVAVTSALGYYVMRWQRATLVKVSAEQATQNNRWGWAFFALVVVLVVAAVAVKG
jgi:hypothetical protein